MKTRIDLDSLVDAQGNINLVNTSRLLRQLETNGRAMGASHVRGVVDACNLLDDVAAALDR